MIKKWAKILPYCLIVWLTRKFGASDSTFNKRLVKYIRIDKGEFVVWDEENYKILAEKDRKSKEEKRSRKLEKINKQLNKDYSLKRELKQQIKDEEEREKEEYDE